MLGRSRSYGSTAMPPASSIFAPGVLEGRTALITGGGTGLGKAAARELLACGARVLICGRRSEVLEAACAELGEGCAWLAGDVREPAECERIVDATLERFGRLDTLVNNAGGQYFVPAEAIQKYPESVKAGAARSVPLGRLGRPDEHAWLIALLATPLGRRFSGSVITLDGARDNWFGPWPPPTLTDETGAVPTEERRPSG